MTGSVARFVRAMPKVELHVHLEGAIRAETVLDLARRHGVSLPATNPAEMERWYEFRDFAHFVDVYLAVSACLQTPEDIEFIAREFLHEQAAQNIIHSEVTYTAITHFLQHGIPFSEQIAALNRARAWAAAELGVTMTLTIDHPRHLPLEECLTAAEWAIGAMGDGVSAFGLGGPEVGHPPEKFRVAFDRVRDAGLPSVPHAGETEGPASVWGALNALHAVRIGHGVRCLEDPRLVEVLRERQIPLEVCPTSNVCLGVAADLASHPFPRLLEEGLYVTLNSDDPPMFGTTLTGEYLGVAGAFGLDAGALEALVYRAVRATLLPRAERRELERRVTEEMDAAKRRYLEPPVEPDARRPGP